MSDSESLEGISQLMSKSNVIVIFLKSLISLISFYNRCHDNDFIVCPFLFFFLLVISHLQSPFPRKLGIGDVIPLLDCINDTKHKQTDKQIVFTTTSVW